MNTRTCLPSDLITTLKRLPASMPDPNTREAWLAYERTKSVIIQSVDFKDPDSNQELYETAVRFYTKRAGL